MTLHPKLGLTAATLALIIASLVAIQPFDSGWAYGFSVRFRNILGAGTASTTIATALNDPSPTPSLTPTPTSTLLVSIYPSEITATRENHIDQAIHKPAPAPTPPGGE